MKEIDVNRFFEVGTPDHFNLFVVCHPSRIRTLERMVEGEPGYHIMGHTSQGSGLCSLFQSLDSAHRYMELLGKLGQGRRL